jgi:hypothetical protein
MGWIAPAIMGGASLLSGLFGNKAKGDQHRESANLYNDWLRNYQSGVGDIMGNAQAQGWNPYGPRTSTTAGSSYGSTSGRSATNFSNRPEITKEYQGLDALMRGIMEGRLSGGSSLPAGYASTAARGINESFSGADAAARNLAARHGLSGEQAYAVASPANRARAGALADMRAQLPLLEREMQNQDIGITRGLQQAFGTGQRGQSVTNTSGTSSRNTTGTQTTPFGIGDASALAQLLAGPGPMQGMQTGTSGAATGLSSLGSMLGFLMAQGQMPGQGQPAAPNWTGAGMYI